jgi:hypothetical protein
MVNWLKLWIIQFIFPYAEAVELIIPFKIFGIPLAELLQTPEPFRIPFLHLFHYCFLILEPFQISTDIRLRDTMKDHITIEMADNW